MKQYALLFFTAQQILFWPNHFVWCLTNPDSKTSLYSDLVTGLYQSYFFIIQDLFDEDDVSELMAAEATDDCGETKRKQRRFKRKRIVENRSILDTMDQVQTRMKMAE